jgi:hypothetical protein
MNAYAELRSYVADLGQCYRVSRAEIQELRSAVEELKVEVTSLRGQLSGLQNNTALPALGEDTVFDLESSDSPLPVLPRLEVQSYPASGVQQLQLPSSPANSLFRTKHITAKKNGLRKEMKSSLLANYKFNGEEKSKLKPCRYMYCH